MKQLTREQAIKLSESKCYESWPLEVVAQFQLEQDRLCMDFSYFHKAVEEAFGRPVAYNEFACKSIRDHFKDSPTITTSLILAITKPLPEDIAALFAEIAEQEQ